MYCVYILKSLKDKKHYVGMTKDVSKRFYEHNNGRVKSTKHRVPFQVIYVEEVQDRITARKREIYWKSGVGREKINKEASLADLPMGKFKKADLPAGRRAH